MMRIPIAIVMLCLPVAAMGEIFSCTSTFGAYINGDQLVRQGVDNRNWIVDTERGVRLPTDKGVTQDYFGECEVRSLETYDIVWCTAEGVNGAKSHIELMSLANGQSFFMASVFQVFNQSYSGTCIEI